MTRASTTPEMSTETSAQSGASADGETDRESYWDRIEDSEVATDFNQVSKAFLGPSLPDRPFEGLNAITFVREEMTRVYDGRKVLPGLLEVDQDLIDAKSNEESYPCEVVQVSSLQQFVLVDDDVYRINGCSLSGYRDEGQYYEVRIKCDFAKEIDDPELIATVKELASRANS